MKPMTLNKKGRATGPANSNGMPSQDTTITVNIPPGASLNGPAKPAFVLEELLNHFQRVDFREKMELEEDERPKQKHYVVLIVEEVLEVAKGQNYGLAVQNDFIYIYNGIYWAALDRNEFKIFLAQAAERMKYPQLECKHYTFRNELYQQFLAVAYIPPPEPPQDVTLINLLNGTLEVTPDGFRLREHRRSDFLTYVLPFEYGKEADCPQFLAYLEEVQPDEDARKVLGEYVGYVFTRHLKLEKMLLLYGSGANGKSVFFDILNALLGKENISNYSLANLNEEHNRAMIVNKLLNYGSEIRGKIDIDVLKQMASGEPIQARMKYGNSFITERYAKLAFNCNELPHTVEHNEAYFRRFIILPFDVTIPEERRNPNLAKEIIQEELPGVLNWVLVALERLLARNKFTECEKAKKALKKYRTESDSVAMFLEDEDYQPSQDKEKLLKDLFNDYRPYCIDNGYRAVSNRNFSKRLKALGYEMKKTNKGQVVFIEK